MAPATGATRRGFFHHVTRHPRSAIAACLCLLLLPLAHIGKLEKDTRSDAFLEPGNPALVYKERIRRTFGLSDPIVIALLDRGTAGIYSPATLAFLKQVSERVAGLDNINRARVASLATEKNIRVVGDDIVIREFLDPLPTTSAEARQLRADVEDFELYTDTLVSADGRMALVVAQMIDERAADETYARLGTLLDSLEPPPGVELHLAGEGVIAGYLGSYIDSDALRLNPLAGLVINLTIILAFLRLNPALMSNAIIVASALGTLGAMAWFGIPFYVITNALPVILIGISVADAIHIYSEYYRLRDAHPADPVEDVVERTMRAMFRPITLTTLTTACGFLGLYFAAMMPPFRYFGLFAALGVTLAWLFSIVFLPAAMVLSKPRGSRLVPAGTGAGGTDAFGRLVGALGQVSLRHSRATLALGLLIALAGLYAASQLVIDEDRIDLFHRQEAVYRADKLINRHMAGTNVLYIVVEAGGPDALLEPAVLRRIEALQEYAESLEGVGATLSVVDYLKQMHKVLQEGGAENYRLPDTRESVAQYLLLYSAIADPTDFEDEITSDYSDGLVTVNLRAGSYLSIKPVVENLQAYLDRNFGDGELDATLSGRVSLNYYWFRDLGYSHFLGMIVAVCLVWAVSSLLFRSAMAGLLALVPVGGAVLLVYASMVVLGITLGIGSSMFAAVAIGLGVDFAIHTLDRLRSLYREYGQDESRIYAEFYRTTGRALFFNFLAITCGFGVLISSKIASLNQFGSIVVLAVSTSFIASLTLLPALVKLTRPSFMTTGGTRHRNTPGGGAAALLGLLALSLVLPGPSAALAEEELDAEAIVARVNDVDEGSQLTRKVTMIMTDQGGRQREQISINYRKTFGEDRRIVLFFLEPSNIRGTAMLIWDYADTERADDQWLYLPALRRSRRVSTDDRGGYFLGTDLTYEDMKLDGKFEPLDYTFTLVGEQTLDERPVYVLEAVPRSEDIARELGYSRTVSWIDAANWMLVRSEFYDLKGELLKTLEVDDIRQVDGYWTKHELTVQNHQTGHHTRFLFSDVDYETPVEDRLFSKQALSRGP